MTQRPLRIGLIGAGANTRLRHIPGLQALEDVEIAAVCNRRPESTAAVAREFAIPRTFENWQDLVADPDIDAIVIGTWPYLHCPITLGALESLECTQARKPLRNSATTTVPKPSRTWPISASATSSRPQRPSRDWPR